MGVRSTGSSAERIRTEFRYSLLDPSHALGRGSIAGNGGVVREATQQASKHTARRGRVPLTPPRRIPMGVCRRRMEPPVAIAFVSPRLCQIHWCFPWHQTRIPAGFLFPSLVTSIPIRKRGPRFVVALPRARNQTKPNQSTRPHPPVLPSLLQIKNCCTQRTHQSPPAIGSVPSPRRRPMRPPRGRRPRPPS